jgi:hypothetical protein
VTQVVILIHGAPACGKLTTARALAADSEMPVLHNHLTFNAARVLFPKVGDPRLNELHRALRLTMIEHALAGGIEAFILTLVYSEAESAGHVADIRTVLGRHQALLVPVYLACPPEVLFERVVMPDRAVEDKLLSTERLETLLAEHDYEPINDPNTLVVSNANRSARSVAQTILSHVRNVKAAE